MKVYLLDEGGKIVDSMYSDTKGYFNFEKLNPDRNYSFKRSESKDMNLALLDADNLVIEEAVINDKGNFTYKKLTYQVANFEALTLDDTQLIENNRTQEIFGQVYQKLPGDFKAGMEVYVYNEAGEVVDQEFIGRAREYVNLIASYQPDTARIQFKHASRYLVEPVLSTFKKQMLQQELQIIENTRRTQLFFIDPTKTEIERIGYDRVIVTFRGSREKLVAGKKVPEVLSQFRVFLTTIPRNELNPFGIVITNIETTNVVKE